jgi:hypothetical protein
MIPRRFVNLVMKDSRAGGSYWLSRLTAQDNLFYSSVGEAVASETQARRERRTTIRGSTMELPSPLLRFKSSHSFDSTLGFMPFYGVGGGPKEGRIVVSNSDGDTHLYDAEDLSCEVLSRTKGLTSRHSPISVCITKDAILADALYAINASTSTNFKTLAYCNGNSMAWEWLELPLPPYRFGEEDRTIQSYTVLKDNKTICFSSVSEGGGFGTYCFDTVNREWTKAGSWTLPFLGCALCVPQLYNLHFGFHESNPENIVALDLPSPLEGNAPPEVLHMWRGFCQHDLGEEWSLIDSNLLYMGHRRFCATKFYGIFDESAEICEYPVNRAAVLTGLEIVNRPSNKAKLQMIKHKTRIYIFKGCSIESVL